MFTRQNENVCNYYEKSFVQLRMSGFFFMHTSSLINDALVIKCYKIVYIVRFYCRIFFFYLGVIIVHIFFCWFFFSFIYILLLPSSINDLTNSKKCVCIQLYTYIRTYVISKLHHLHYNNVFFPFIFLTSLKLRM